MRKAFKYRIYLTKGQRRLLEQQLEDCRWVYNETLAYRKRVHSQVLQNVTQRVDLAFQAFFRRIREGVEEAGFPRFKGKGRYHSYRGLVLGRDHNAAINILQRGLFTLRR